MPSYRMHLPIGALRRGCSPVDVMEQAVLALGTLHVVEQQDVEAPTVGGRRVGRVARAADATTHAAEMLPRHALAVSSAPGDTAASAPRARRGAHTKW